MDKELRYKAVLQDHKDRIFRICCCYLRNSNERNDAYQEVLIHLWQSLDSFEGKSQMSTWVYRIAVNTCLGFLRSERRRTRVFEPAGERNEELMANYPAEESDGTLEKEVQLLYAFINELPLMDKTLASMYLEDLSTKEMADVTGLSESNIRVKIHRIKKVLKEKFEEDYDEAD